MELMYLNIFLPEHHSCNWGLFFEKKMWYVLKEQKKNLQSTHQKRGIAIYHRLFEVSKSYNMKQKILDILDQLEIEYTNYEHDAVFTCDEAKGVDIPGYRVKSLLLRNKKATNFYMVVLPDNKQLDTNIIRSIFDDSKMSFASPERMMEKI